MKRARSSERASRRERGAALVTVLTMLAVMSTLAVVVVDAANISVRSTANLTRMEQTRWYLMGAEAFAVTRIAELRRRFERDRVDQSEWQNRAFTFPLDDGLMQVSLSDGANCLNLNSVVSADEGGVLASSARGMVQLARLMDLIGVQNDRGGLAAALGDWIDTDSRPNLGGAEDDAYGGLYRTGNTLIADIAELRGVNGFDEQTIRRLAPFVCVRPTSAANAINPNTLTIEQAPLLAAALSDLTIDGAQQVIRDRPRGGWEDLDHFFAHPRLATIGVTEAARSQFSLQSTYFVLRASVERDGARESSAALLAAPGGARAVVVRRIFGAGAAENAL